MDLVEQDIVDAIENNPKTGLSSMDLSAYMQYGTAEIFLEHYNITFDIIIDNLLETVLKTKNVLLTTPLAGFLVIVHSISFKEPKHEKTIS